MAKLIESGVAKLVVKEGDRDAYLWDSSLPGFGVRAYASGKKSFICKYQLPDGRQRKLSLGTALPGTLAETRRKAQDILAKARLGQDVVGEKAAARERAETEFSTDMLVDRYLKIRKTNRDQGKLSARSYTEIGYHLNRLLAPLQGHAPETIRQRDISNLMDDLVTAKGATTADRFKTSVNGFFAWLMEKEYVGANPCSQIKARNTVGPRQRCLTLGELQDVWRATSAPTDYDRIVRLLALTAARRDEIGALRWSEIDLDAGEINLPKERVKTGRKTGNGHKIFLSEPAISILKGISRRPGRDFVFGIGDGPFSGWSRSKAALDAKLPEQMRATRLNAKGKAEKNPTAWTLHDLRRTFATTVMARGLATADVKDAALGHAKQGIKGTYDVGTYDEQRRVLMHNWAKLVLGLGGEDADEAVAA